MLSLSLSLDRVLPSVGGILWLTCCLGTMASKS
jgi:hypothetical protein